MSESLPGPLLRLEAYGRRYGYRIVLSDIDLELHAGEILCLLGPNGAGKTSLLEAILSHHRPPQARLYYREKEIRGLEEHQRFLSNCAYLGHDPGLLYDLSALENLQYFADLSCRERPDNDTLREILDLVGLLERAEDRAREFSRGMRQRLGLARCLVHRPDLLFLDEPLTGLDEGGVILLRNILQREKGRGASAIVITHDDGPFGDIAERFLFLKKGRLIADIPTARYTKVAKDKVRELIAAP